MAAVDGYEAPVLWHLEISHYSEKVRWALDYKDVAHVRRAVTPALQQLRALRLRAGRTLPILEMNGRAIGDSTCIIEELERRWREPPLFCFRRRWMPTKSATKPAQVCAPKGGHIDKVTLCH